MQQLFLLGLTVRFAAAGTAASYLAQLSTAATSGSAAGLHLALL